jgi:hypothetical protein
MEEEGKEIQLKGKVADENVHAEEKSAQAQHTRRPN